MRIEKLRVKPKKALASSPCSAEFAALLACWASTGDVMGAPLMGVGAVPRGGPAAQAANSAAGPCREAMMRLEECMRRGVSDASDSER